MPFSLVMHTILKNLISIIKLKGKRTDVIQADIHEGLLYLHHRATYKRSFWIEAKKCYKTLHKKL